MKRSKTGTSKKQKKLYIYLSIIEQKRSNTQHRELNVREYPNYVALLTP